MESVLVSGRANRHLADALAARSGLRMIPCVVEDFPDGELHVRLEAGVAGRDVWVVQPTGPSAERHLLELLLIADAALRAGARRIAAVVPYFGYARQERRTAPGEPVGARLMADLLSARVREIVAVDLHAPAVEGFFNLPVRHLTAVPLLAEALRRRLPPDPVVVAPDQGAVELARRYAESLGLPLAAVEKHRLGGREVRARAVRGRVEGRSPVLVDDMVSTGGTLVSAAQTLLDAGCGRRFAVAVTHGLFVEDASARLAELPLELLVTTDSVPQAENAPFPKEVVSLAPVLADALRP